MLDQLRAFEPTSLPKGEFTHQQKVISVTELAEVLSSNLVFVPLDEKNPVRVENGFPTQYEPVHVEDGVVTHFTLKTPSQEESVSISDYIRQYIETGTIRLNMDTGDSDIHEIPLPTYPIVQHSNQFVPCVRLKNNKRALIVGNTIIEGVAMPE